MAYTRTNWVSGETPLSATNMNNIEDGIEELSNNLPFTIKIIEVSATIPQGSKASPSSTEINLSSYAPQGKHLYNAMVSIGTYSLPYIGPDVATYTYINSISSNKITIFNGGTTWTGTQTLYIIGFFK